MSKQMPNWFFHMMALEFKLRDYFRPRKLVIADIGIKLGDSILDFGCGPGGYILPAAELAGQAGRVYALDIHPLAVKYVKDLAQKHNLANITTILSGSSTGLRGGSIDVILLYDILHGLGEVKAGFKEIQYVTGQRLTATSNESQLNTILNELHRVLKPAGILSVNDHHLTEAEIITKVKSTDLFELSFKSKRCVNFKQMSSS